MSFSPFQPSHSQTPSIVPQCRGTAPHRSVAPHTSQQRGPNPPHQRQLGGSCSFEHRKRDDSQRLHEVAEGLGMELLPGLTYGQRWATGKLLLPTEKRHSKTGKAALQPWLQAGGQHCNQHLGFKLSEEQRGKPVQQRDEMAEERRTGKAWSSCGLLPGTSHHWAVTEIYSLGLQTLNHSHRKLYHNRISLIWS